MAYTVQEIADALGLPAVGDTDLMLAGPAQPAEAGADDLALAMVDGFARDLHQSAARAALIGEGQDWRALGLSAAIIAQRPKVAMSGVTQLFASQIHAPAGIHPSAIVSDSAHIGDGASIGPFCVIEPGAKIGRNARILSHVSIGADAVIGDDVLLHAGVRIGARVSIGQRFIAQPNAVVGGDGFSFATPEPGAVEAARKGRNAEQAQLADNAFLRTHSLGAVEIGDDVELGAGSTIDRGTIKNTRIGTGTKIDNLVMIGHNVAVGRHCLLCAQVGLGGSSVVADHVVLGGQVGVADHVHIGSNVVAAGKSGISSNVPGNRFIMGNPAFKMAANVESYKAYRRLPQLVAKLEKLQKQVSKLGADD